MNTDILTLAIIGHLVGDYLLQNDWMALNKKQSAWHCAVHCWIWANCVCWFAGWSNWFTPFFSTHCNTVPFTVLCLTHFLQDKTNIIAWWMDFIGQKQFRTGPCAPWSSIVVDNVWHIVTVWLVWRFSV